MLQFLFISLKNPQILLQSYLLKKRIIWLIACMIAVIAAIPPAVQIYSNVSTLDNNFVTISENLPSFTMTDGQFDQNSQQTSKAIQTDYIYFLYDVENKVTESAISSVVDNNLVNLILKPHTYTVYIYGTSYIQQTFNRSDTLTTNDFKTHISQLHSTLDTVRYLLPFMILFYSLLTVAMQNLLYTFASSIALSVTGRIVKFKHLWRVSLFTSIVPITLFSIATLFLGNIPFKEYIMTAYIVHKQFVVLKDVRPE